MRAIMHAASAFNPNALSRAGAQGLMQLMPATAARFGVVNAFDPEQNIRGGVKYLAWLLKRFNGDLTLAAAGYNAGEGAVRRYGNKIPPYKETQNYVKTVMTLYASLQPQGVGDSVSTLYGGHARLGRSAIDSGRIHMTLPASGGEAGP